MKQANGRGKYCDFAIIALLAVGAILFVLIFLGVLATLGQGVFYNFVKDFQTLIGAAVGFGGLIWVTRQGFREARKSREHQAKLDRDRDENLRKVEAKILASAIHGELVAIIATCKSHNIWLQDMVPRLEDLHARYPKGKMPLAIWPALRASIFEANAGRIGMLGPVLAYDVAWIYSTLLNMSDRRNDRGELSLSTLVSTMKSVEPIVNEHIENIETTAEKLTAFIDSHNT